MTRSLSRWQALLLGLVLLLGGGGTAVGLFAVGGRYWPWDNSFRIQAGFAKVHGVEPGTRVRVQGIDAGDVEEVRLPTEPGGDVVLVFRLRPQLRNLIRSDAVAQIVNEGMVGGKVVEIYPGTSVDPVADNARIASLPSSDLQDAIARMGNLKEDPLYKSVIEMAQQGTRTLKEGEQTMASVRRAT
ncbi:MAG TPA: MCE family protein, partial [Gemmataceae bacterium]|nr:MCE family protein [Gemmataceae bacterium]